MNSNLDVEKLQEKVNLINTQIDTFQVKLSQAPNAIKSEYTFVVDDLKNKKLKLEEKVERLKEATENSYKDFQIGVDMAWEDLNVAYSSAKRRFAREFS